MKSLKLRIASALGAGVLVLSGSTAVLAHEIAPATAVQQTQEGQATFGNLIAALNNINVQIQRLSALNGLTVSNVRLVNVQDLVHGNNFNALNNALNRNDVDINVLQNFLNNSGNNNNVNVIRNVLNDAQINVSRVVAIDVLSGGDVIVFYR